MTTLNPCPFGYFNDDNVYQVDADKIIIFVLRKLGEDILSVELTKKMIWTCFEEATLQFNGNIIEYQAKSNLSVLLGLPTGSIDPETGKSTVNLTNTYIQPNLEFLVRQAAPYASEVGFGQSEDSYSGSIKLLPGVQDYDMYASLVDQNDTPLASYMPSGSAGRMKIFEVYHNGPTQYVFNSNLASNFIASGLPVESYVPDTRFYVLPLFEDILRAQMLESASKVRRSHYRYRISGRHLRIYPAPGHAMIPDFNDKLWIRMGFPSNGGIPYPSGSYSISGSSGFYPSLPDGVGGGAGNPGNIPLGLISYNSLNPWAKNWIFQYTLALATVLLGRVRTKFKNFPIPGAELTLNGDDLVTQGREDIQNLLYGEGGLIQKLDGLTYEKLAEMDATKAENQLKQLQYLPTPPKYVISFG